MKTKLIILITIILIPLSILYYKSKQQLTLEKLKRIKVRELFHTKTGELKRILNLSLNNKIIFLNYPSCSACYENYFSQQSSSIKYNYSILVVYSNLTHKQIWDNLKDFISLFNKTEVLNKNSYQDKLFHNKNEFILEFSIKKYGKIVSEKIISN